MRQIEFAVIKIIEEELKAKIADQKYVNVGGVDNVATILTLIDKGTCQNILENLQQNDPDLVKDLQQAMITAHTLRKLENEGKITINH